MHRLSPLLLRAERPPRAVGALLALAGVAAATALIYPLRSVAPVVSLGVVYLLVVVVVSMFWGLAFGLATAVLSVAAFSFFHLPPVGRFTLADGRNWIGLAAFTVVAAATGFVAEIARAAAREAERRRVEADLAAALAQLLLGASDLEQALSAASRRIEHVIDAAPVDIRLGDGPPEGPQDGLPLRGEGERLGVLLLPQTLSRGDLAWIGERIVPPLESILAAALHRAELQSEVVETAALRRSDELKTAVLRSVSHDLRTPVAAILTSIGALECDQPTAQNARAVRELVNDAGTRLWTLIEKLLDLSRLQAGQLEPRRMWCSIEEVLDEAIEQTRAPREAFRLSVPDDLPLVMGDPAQLERALANVLENAARFSAGHPVIVRARAARERLRIRIVDRGPGIAPREQERVFLPFYRSPEAGEAHHGSGLGLAIAKGFIEASGGQIGIESVPGQGTSFVIELPLVAAPAPALAVR